MSDTNGMDGSRRGAGTGAPSGWFRGLDLCVSALGYALGGSILALPWALYRGAEPIWFREGQFVVAMTLLIVGVFLLRPRRRRHRRVSNSNRSQAGVERGLSGVEGGDGGVEGGDGGADSGDGGVDGESGAEGRRSTRDEHATGRSHSPRHHRLLADLLDRPPLAPSERVARGWRLLLASALLLALSLGIEVVVS